MARILIVDDQDMMRDSLAQTLVREGHEVVAAPDGAAAAARLGAARFDLLITDLRMPKITGLELLAGQTPPPRDAGRPDDRLRHGLQRRRGHEAGRV